MIEFVDIKSGASLDDYAVFASLSQAVHDLRAEAASIVPKLSGRRIWMVNSTAKGGGVAEMLPRMIGLLRQLGVDAQWVVIQPKEEAFFDLTKRLHNMIHGAGPTSFSPEDPELYDTVSAGLATAMERHVSPRDLLVIHDPQPAGMGAVLARKLGVRSLWRCHIGLDEDLPQTRAAWDFLQTYLEPYNLAVFSAPEYIPPYMNTRARLIYPALDPTTHKNRDISPHKLVGILANSAVVHEAHPVTTPPFQHPVRRCLGPDKFVRATEPEDLGILYRPVVTQVSRWDALKGWEPLLEGFIKLKRDLSARTDLDAQQRRRLEVLRLVMAGPEPEAVADDPEAKEVLDKLAATVGGLPDDIAKDVALLLLPMSSTKENSLIVNALQRSSSVVVQNSIREGFGLTVTEAMWKGVPVLGSRACGLRQQIRDQVDGRLVSDPKNPDEIASVLSDMLGDPIQRAAHGVRGQRRVFDEFLIFVQLRKWLHALERLAEAPGPAE